MSTPNETPDPFMSPGSPSPSGQQPEAPPAPMAPPGYAQAAPGYAPTAAGGYTPITVAPSASNKLALWAIILTGAYTAATLLSAALSPMAVDSLKKVIEDPDNASPFAGSNPADALAFPLGVASFVLLALWMSKIRNSRKARGEVVGGPPAVEWWGWFVPFANAVLPFLGMRAITKGRASMGLLLGWWLAYVAATLVSISSFATTFGTIDWSTGEMTKTDGLDSLVGIYWASAILLAVSWVFLAMIIRVTSRREAEGVTL